MADVNNLKAEFGSAYVRAVAHTAGYFVPEANRMMDADGVDLTIFARGSRGQMRSPRLDVQLKTTQHGLEDEAVTLDLPVKNYDELRAAGYQTPVFDCRVLPGFMSSNSRHSWLASARETCNGSPDCSAKDSCAQCGTIDFVSPYKGMVASGVW